jgi:hypothetical protein
VRLDEILGELAAVVVDTAPVLDAARIDRIARLEKLRSVTAAVQVAESVRFAQSQVAEQLAAGVHPDRIGRGVAEQIGLACRISPVAAACRLTTARALWFELPDSYTQLVAGELSERLADTVVGETRHLDPQLRRQVDGLIAARGVSAMGFKAATGCIRAAAYQADRQGYLQRGRTERKHRRVGCRPAPDTMAVLTGYLPVEQGIACYTAFDEIITTSQGRKWWRRLFTAPSRAAGSSGPIVGGDPTRRYFDGWLAKLIRLRDQTCRDPFCDAPIATSTTSNATPTVD